MYIHSLLVDMFAVRTKKSYLAIQWIELDVLEWYLPSMMISAAEYRIIRLQGVPGFKRSQRVSTNHWFRSLWVLVKGQALLELRGENSYRIESYRKQGWGN